MIVLLSLSPEWSVYFLFTKALNSAKALANERFIAPIVLESQVIANVTEKRRAWLILLRYSVFLLGLSFKIDNLPII